MKRVLAQLIEALERFWTYLVATALLLALASSLFSSRSNEPPQLTKKNVQQALVKRPGHIVPHRALRYKGEDGWTWESKEVLFLSQEDDTYAVARVEEKGVRPEGFGFWARYPDYELDTRIVDYELRRESPGDDWCIDTIDGKQFRRYLFLKYYLKFEENGEN
jgi:hypothetical protein